MVLQGFLLLSLQKEITIQIDLEVLSKSNSNSTKYLVKSLTSSVQNAPSSNTIEANELKNLRTGQDTLRLVNVLPVGDVSSLCSKGAVIDSYSEGSQFHQSTKVGCGTYSLTSFSSQ